MVTVIPRDKYSKKYENHENIIRKVDYFFRDQ